ncbi:MAG TPA: Hsp20/alpha crystallin family protein [Terriglobales bacterium]|jgi:HSP20 family molecular chaperone IbpA|nr:Hsp20/alpha crystallin family protein [Terriglobales bacterium]
MAEQTVAKNQAQGAPLNRINREGTRSQERSVTPPVDIYEDADGLVVKADLPGVAKENLDVRVENNLLTIHGQPSHVVAGEPIYREYELVSFYRQFELSERVDQTKISAELKHGVLTLHLPKAEEAKPRKVEVAVN